MISNISSVIYTCLFLLPGGIISAIIKNITPTRKHTSSQELLRWLAYSVLNGAIWSWVFVLIWNKFDQSSVLFWIVLLLTVSISSVITGCVLGIIQSKNIVRSLASKMGLKIEHSIPTAWDYVFSNRDTPCYVIVSMDDGTKYYGYFGENSLASSDNDNRDIYLEYTYYLDDEGNWTPASNRRGALINSSHISSIEFLEQGEETNE